MFAPTRLGSIADRRHDSESRDDNVLHEVPSFMREPPASSFIE
jgi:hypothetical protein